MNIKIFEPLLFLILVSSQLLAQKAPQNPYRLDWKKDASVLTIGLGLSLGGQLAVNNVGSRSEMDLGQASFKNILGLDGGARDNYSTSAQKASDLFLGTSVVLPFVLLADADIRQDAGKIAVLGSETLLITYGLANLAKAGIRRDRPFVFNENAPLDEKLAPGSRLSFFSGHTSVTAAASFFTAKIWTDYHPDSRWKPLVWTAAAALPAVTGYLRVKAGKHYVSDVATGYAVGALVGFFVPHFHKFKRGEKRKLRMSTSMVGEVPVFNVRYRF